MISFSFDKQRGQVNVEWMSRPVDSYKNSKINQPLALVLTSMEQSPTFASRLKRKLLSGPILGGAYNSTYLGHQSYRWGDGMMYYYGKWEVKNGVLILYKGRDISEDLKVDEVEDIKSDTLIIKIGEDLLRALPRIHFSIDSDTADLKVTDNEIEIVKKRYWDIFHPSIEDDSYEYAPVKLNIRSGNAYAVVDYIFKNKEVSISLSNSLDVETKADSILCKYELRNGILFSFDETYEIEKNNLKRE